MAVDHHQLGGRGGAGPFTRGLPHWRRWAAILMASGVLATAATARAEIQDWQVNEVLTSHGGDAAVRYVELWNQVGGCFFPSTQLRVYDAAGQSVGQVNPVSVTTCFGPDTYFLLATPAAVTAFDTVADVQMVPALPATAGQLCFASSATRYDCVRWGAISSPVVDLFGPDDLSSAVAPGDGVALARVATTHVVSVDFALAEPTPRGPNDGSPWFPPDAGPSLDAAPTPDAAPPGDAGPHADAYVAVDARARVDASGTRYLDLDPQGGATCGCRTTPADGLPGAAILLLVAWAGLSSRRDRALRAHLDQGRRS